MEISIEDVKKILPSDVKLKAEQRCLDKGHFCGVFRGVDACVIPVFETDKDGNTTLVKLHPCSKTGKSGFDIE